MAIAPLRTGGGSAGFVHQGGVGRGTNRNEYTCAFGKGRRGRSQKGMILEGAGRGAGLDDQLSEL